jgi:hypothetical protein
MLFICAAYAAEATFNTIEQRPSKIPEFVSEKTRIYY